MNTCKSCKKKIIDRKSILMNDINWHLKQAELKLDAAKNIESVEPFPDVIYWFSNYVTDHTNILTKNGLITIPVLENLMRRDQMSRDLGLDKNIFENIREIKRNRRIEPVIGVFGQKQTQLRDRRFSNLPIIDKSAKAVIEKRQIPLYTIRGTRAQTQGFDFRKLKNMYIESFIEYLETVDLDNNFEIIAELKQRLTKD